VSGRDQHPLLLDGRATEAYAVFLKTSFLRVLKGLVSCPRADNLEENLASTHSTFCGSASKSVDGLDCDAQPLDSFMSKKGNEKFDVRRLAKW